MMKVALFVNHIYSKICYLFLVLGIGFLCATIYLYLKLPNVIPVHWGLSFEVDSWGRKETLFILPISLFLCLILSSKKFIHAHETNPFRIMAAELVLLGVLTLLVIAMSYVYAIYFSLL
ncbi:DUF1648 domain-containing protein [Pseudolactococcus paracarnosus]|nr:DUF1648 domain-containing protein [Lactococcus paracarnosus]SPC38010.1 conserved membrane hypothetical protein [Lactococcus piscium]